MEYALELGPCPSKDPWSIKPSYHQAIAMDISLAAAPVSPALRFIWSQSIGLLWFTLEMAPWSIYINRKYILGGIWSPDRFYKLKNTILDMKYTYEIGCIS